MTTNQPRLRKKKRKRNQLTPVTTKGNHFIQHPYELWINTCVLCTGLIGDICHFRDVIYKNRPDLKGLPRKSQASVWYDCVVTAAADLWQLQQSQNKSEAGGNARLAQWKETPAVRSLNHVGKIHPREPRTAHKSKWRQCLRNWSHKNHIWKIISWFTL